MNLRALISLLAFASALCAESGEASARSSIDLRGHRSLDDFDGCTLHAKWNGKQLMLLGRHIQIPVSASARNKPLGSPPNLVLVKVNVRAKVLNTRVTKVMLQVMDRADQKLDGRYWLSSPEPPEQILQHVQKRLPQLRFFLGKSVGFDVPEKQRAYYGLPTSIAPSLSEDGLLETGLYDSAWLVVSKGIDGSSTLFVSRCQNMMPNPSVNTDAAR